MTASPEKVLRSAGWLAQQPVALQDALLRRGRIRRYPVGDFVIQPDDPPTGVFAICEGSIGVYLTDAIGELVLAEVLLPGAWLGERPLMNGKARVRTFRAMEPTAAWYIELAYLKELSVADPEFGRLLGTISLEAQDIAARVIQDLLIRDAERRIAAILLRVSGASGGNTEPVARLGHGELAEMSSLSRNSVGRALKRFEKSGWIVMNYRTISVVEADKLGQFVRTAPLRSEPRNDNLEG